MKYVILFLTVSFVSFRAVAADAEGGAVVMTADSQSTSNEFCLFTGLPPANLQYNNIGRIKVGKGTYGSVVDILPEFAERARAKGADAIINYIGSQRFGFWPWRFVRPVVRGEAIRWVSPQKPRCSEVGGTTVGTVVMTGKEPPR